MWHAGKRGITIQVEGRKKAVRGPGDPVPEAFYFPNLAVLHKNGYLDWVGNGKPSYQPLPVGMPVPDVKKETVDNIKLDLIEKTTVTNADDIPQKDIGTGKKPRKGGRKRRS